MVGFAQTSRPSLDGVFPDSKNKPKETVAERRKLNRHHPDKKKHGSDGLKSARTRPAKKGDQSPRNNEYA